MYCLCVQTLVFTVILDLLLLVSDACASIESKFLRVYYYQIHERGSGCVVDIGGSNDGSSHWNVRGMDNDFGLDSGLCEEREYLIDHTGE